jgi:trehalose-phosphatase
VYAGNHGLEIRGPQLQLVHESALAARPELERALMALRVSVKAIEGAHVEDKRLSLAVHYRQARASNAEQMLRERVTDVLLQFTQLRCAEGKKVFEIVPAIQWDKGRALEWIRSQLRIPASAPVVFLGDDRTDEDAFRVVAADGGGIIVADPPPNRTAASYFLRSPAEVIEFLRLLAQL